MNKKSPNISPFQIGVEYTLMSLIVLGLIYTLWFLFHYRYLPQPFFYEPSGTFMDWYSLSYYSVNKGAYDIEGSIYPPLSFVLMKVFSIKECYLNSRGEPSRDCDFLGVIVLTVALLIAGFCTCIALRKVDRNTWIPRGLAMALGLPMIYAYERGNLVLICYTCVLLAYGPLLKSARAKWLWGGIAINFKVYLVGAALAPLLKRRWLQTEGILISAVFVYLVTWMILGEGDPRAVVGNITYYASQFGAGRVLDLWYPSSFVPAISLLRGEYFPILSLLESETVDRLLGLCLFLLYSASSMIMLAAVSTWLRPEVVPFHRVVFLAISVALVTSEAGGYTEILFLVFVFMEKWRGFNRTCAIIMAYLLCIPGEYVIERVQPIVRWSWIAGQDVIADYGVGVMSLLRPVMVVVIIWCLSLATVNDVIKDIRSHGHRGRWRFRRDAPLLPGVVEPDSPNRQPDPAYSQST